MVVSLHVRANVIQAKQNAPVSHARSVRMEKRRIATRDQVLHVPQPRVPFYEKEKKAQFAHRPLSWDLAAYLTTKASQYCLWSLRFAHCTLTP